MTCRFVDSMIQTPESTCNEDHAGIIFTSPRRFHRARTSYPEDLVAARDAFSPILLAGNVIGCTGSADLDCNEASAVALPTIRVEQGFTRLRFALCVERTRAVHAGKSSRQPALSIQLEVALHLDQTTR